MTGGGGNDVFRYQPATGSTTAGRDSIQDFSLGDLIDLSRIDANIGTAGDEHTGRSIGQNSIGEGYCRRSALIS